MKTVTVYISLFLLSFFSVSLMPEEERTSSEQKDVTSAPVLHSTFSRAPFTHDFYSHSSDSSTPGTPWYGSHGITETVEQIMERERQHPFHYTGIPREPIREHEVSREKKNFLILKLLMYLNGRLRRIILNTSGRIQQTLRQ